MNYVYLDKSPVDNRYLLNFNIEKLPIPDLLGSMNVLGARILNISFADYCRLCRDELDADIIGKYSLYPIIGFKKNNATLNFLKLLDKRIEFLLLYYKSNDEDREKIKKEYYEK